MGRQKTNPRTGKAEEVGFTDPGLRLIFTVERDSVIGNLTVSASWHNRTYLSAPWEADTEQHFLLPDLQQQQRRDNKKRQREAQQAAEEAKAAMLRAQANARSQRAANKRGLVPGMKIP